MKLTSNLIVLLVSILPITAQAQNTFKKGSVINATNERIEDSLQLSNSKLISISAGHKKKIFNAWDIKGFSIDTVNYISFSNDFYKEIINGNKASLYQKITDNKDKKIFVGPDVVGFEETTDGRIGDYYIQIAGQNDLVLVKKKDFKEYFLKLFSSNDTVTSKIRNGTLGYYEITEAVKFYNSY